jgi:hypothetical protein
MSGDWPRFDVTRDSPTIGFLHLASQMPGKLRVAHAPWVNHGWHVALHPVGEGLATMPTASGDGRQFTVTLDLCDGGFALRVSDGSADFLPFADGMSIAQLHHDVIAMLDRHRLPSSFNGVPSEVPDAVPFADDDLPREFRPDSARVLRDMLALVVPVFERWRAGFAGKASPVHMFWGAFDLAVTRFSGRPAPPHPGGLPGLPDRITREAYSQEVSSAGFWAGNAVMTLPPMFYSYAYPEPDGFRDVRLDNGAFDADLGEFKLDYEAVRAADDPEAMLATFLAETYAAAADRAHWDRERLEREPVAP